MLFQLCYPVLILSTKEIFVDISLLNQQIHISIEKELLTVPKIICKLSRENLIDLVTEAKLC